MEGAGGGAAPAAGAGRPGGERASCLCRREAHTSNGGEELQAAWRSRPASRHPDCSSERAPEPAKTARVSSAKSIYAP